ncbi:hypothetical protein DDB_G0272140 [Dictyostelium discoideum AX4]|uniref:Uncharacterized protein n=1 Tax=Dictyostelium discoideum TaxID=44689 RepID=Q86JL1_DICDI|nr:hypothetical protein DDB_G0272140 [Dictyostelium discoideum AX4]EAL71222.1 hypothetical protein DDB_G0272140 [Dictyostelium discoideum AX4]|eukprot:XP_645207.1 hypothetical protein DDB_G0272140 [Dictyostelium discoideum AX4]
MFSLITRKSIFGVANFIARAEPKGKAAAGGKKKPGAAKKKRFDRGNLPLKLEKLSPTIFKTKLPDENSKYPDWLFEIEDQLPYDQPVKLLSPEDGQRYYKQISRQNIKTHNKIMEMTKGRGL